MTKVFVAFLLLLLQSKKEKKQRGLFSVQIVTAMSKVGM
jgi:hypothetical protein